MYYMAIILLLFIDVALVSIYIRYSNNSNKYTDAIIINMLLISVCGGKMIDVYSYVSNIGNILYSTVLFILAIMIANKRSDFNTVISRTVLVVVIFNIAKYFISNIDTHLVITEYDKSLYLTSSLRYMIPSCIAFVISTSLFIVLMNKTNYIISIIVSQTIDSLVFFAIAFMGQWDIMINGIIIKCLCGLLLYPVYIYVIKNENKFNENYDTKF